MSSSLSPISYRSPRFPPELFDAILSQRELAKSDLANCCLVSKTFLEISRPLLYETIDFEMNVLPEQPGWIELNRDGEPEPWQGVRMLQHTDSSLELLEILEQNPFLGSLVSTIGYSEYSTSRDVEQHIYRSDGIIGTFLQIAPKARRFFFRCPPRAPWQIMKVEREMTALRATGLAYTISEYETKLYSDLTILEVTCATPELSRIQAPNVRVLRVPFSESNNIDFKHFPKLEQIRFTLSLDEISNREEQLAHGDQEEEERGDGEEEEAVNLTSISSLPHLRSLAFDMDVLSNTLIASIHQLGRLPPRLSRIDFPSLVNTLQINQLLNPDFTFPASQSGFPENLQKGSAVAAALCRACEKLGVELYWISKWKTLGRVCKKVFWLETLGLVYVLVTADALLSIRVWALWENSRKALIALTTLLLAEVGVLVAAACFAQALEIPRSIAVATDALGCVAVDPPGETRKLTALLCAAPPFLSCFVTALTNQGSGDILQLHSTFRHELHPLDRYRLQKFKNYETA
ncbi:hypothetical protein JCM5350_000288 [Sporobolomyces pararoseus]